MHSQTTSSKKPAPKAVILTVLLYVLSIISVAVYTPTPFVKAAAGLVFLNSLFTAFFLRSFDPQSDNPLFLIYYWTFWLVYIFKAFLAFMCDPTSEYVVAAIRIIITPENYIETCVYVTVAHLIVVITTLIFSKRKKTLPHQLVRRGMTARLYLFLALSIPWVIISNLVMYRYGVAIMGSESTSLPFRLSGILFYSRLLILPIFYLYCLEQAVKLGSKSLSILTALAFLFLSLSEIYVRATKAPLIYMGILIFFLLLLLRQQGALRHIKIDMKYCLPMIILSLAIWPVMEAYREARIYGFALDDLVAARTFIGSDAMLDVGKSVYYRLLGFTQYMGLIADDYDFRINDLLFYDGIAGYYTAGYLGYTQAGHASSPSMLGAGVMLFGHVCSPMAVILQLLIMLLFWECSFLFRAFGNPVRCMIAFETINSTMAGTLDDSCFRLFMVLCVAGSLEIIPMLNGRLRGKSVVDFKSAL